MLVSLAVRIFPFAKFNARAQKGGGGGKYVGREFSSEKAFVLACSLCTNALGKTKDRNGEERHIDYFVWARFRDTHQASAS